MIREADSALSKAIPAKSRDGLFPNVRTLDGGILILYFSGRKTPEQAKKTKHKKEDGKVPFHGLTIEHGWLQ